MELNITFRHMDPTDDTVELVRSKAKALAKLQADLVACNVVIDRPHHNRRRGRVFSVQVTLAGSEEVLVASRSPQAVSEAGNVEAAIHHAFRAAKQQLRNQRDRRRTCRTRGSRRSDSWQHRPMSSMLLGAEETLPN